MFDDVVQCRLQSRCVIDDARDGRAEQWVGQNEEMNKNKKEGDLKSSMQLNIVN